MRRRKRSIVIRYALQSMGFHPVQCEVGRRRQMWLFLFVQFRQSYRPGNEVHPPQQTKVPVDDCRYLLTTKDVSSTVAICSAFSCGAPDSSIDHFTRRGPRHSELAYIQEVKLHNGSTGQRRVWDDLATIYSIIVSLEYVEKAYVRDTITQAQYISSSLLL